MKKRKIISFFMIVIVILFWSFPKQNSLIYAEEETKWNQLASPSVSGALQVKNSQLCDCYGNPIQLKGISTHGIAWFPDYINEDCFSELQNNWNVNVIRLAMYTAESGGYCTGGDQKALKALIQKGVEYAVKQDLYILIDWHILSDGNPITYKEEAKKFFAEMAEAYADCPNVLYEICNEPNGQVSWAEIKAYAEEIISVIREKDKDGIIIVGTPNWSQYVDQALANPIINSYNIMYALHFYAATHTQTLRDSMTKAVEEGLPIFVTEFGICDASGNGSIDFEQAKQWVAQMNTYNISYIAWNLSNKNETSAILKSTCQKKNGFEKEDLSEAGKWLYSMFTGQNIPSEKAALEESYQIDTVGKSSKFEYEIVEYACWESEGKNYYQYGVKVKNTSEMDCNSWQIAIPFDQKIMLQNGWNGEYFVDENVLYIAAKEYNGKILRNGIIEGIGFIISKSQ